MVTRHLYPFLAYADGGVSLAGGVIRRWSLLIRRYCSPCLLFHDVASVLISIMSSVRDFGGQIVPIYMPSLCSVARRSYFEHESN